MTFGLTAASIAGIGLGVSAIGTGVSIASATGAFGGTPGKWAPTPEELAAARAAKQVNKLGQQIQKPLDSISRDDLGYLNSQNALDESGSMGVDQMWRNVASGFGNSMVPIAAASGGPGSGRWFDQMGLGANNVNNATMDSNVQGRVNGLNKYLGRTEQFLNRRTADLKAGLGAMTSGGQQAADAQAQRINAQIQNKAAANAAMGQIGGSLMSVGMGLSGLGGAASGLSSVGGETANSAFQGSLNNVASQYNLAGSVPGGGWR